MEPPGVPVLAISGYTKTGKTTFIERLIPALTRRGLRVATVKHHHRGDISIDIPGTDTYRHKKAGAATTILASPGMIGLVKDLEEEMPLEEIVSRYVSDADICIVEGYKHAAVPRIEMYLRERRLKPFFETDAHVIAVVADGVFSAPVPVFSRDDVETVADFIVACFGRQR